jgi:hypothetical protein
MEDGICKDCGFIGEPVKMTKGSLWIEIALWFFFLVPGIIYSIWRLTSRYIACSKCGSSDIIPLDSPMGQKLAKEQAPPPPVSHVVPPRKSTADVADLASRYGDFMARKR